MRWDRHGAGARRDRGRARRRPHAGRDAVRSGRRDGAAAARLPVGRRLGVRQSRRARAQGARRDDAARILDRSADVPGRVRQHARRVRRHRAGRRGVGHRLRGRGRGDHRRRADGHDGGRCAAPRPPADARQRRQPAQPDSGRARQGIRVLPVEAGERILAGRGHAGRARAPPGATARCTCRSSRTSTAGCSGARMRAST